MMKVDADSSSEIAVVGWDIDRVAHDNYSTSLLADHADTDPRPAIRQFVEEGRLSKEYVERWQEENADIKSSKGYGETDDWLKSTTVKQAADMLTDALYDWGQQDGEIVTPGEAAEEKCDPVMSKEDTIYTKQKILGGITKQKAREIAEKMDFTPGFRDAVESFYERNIKQTAFSDGADWVVGHLVENFPYSAEDSYFDDGGGVPPQIKMPDGSIEQRQSYDEVPESAEMTGEINDFNKARAFFDYLGGEGIGKDQVAVIDDSGANVSSLLLPVKDEGGIAVGFNVKDKYKSDFTDAGIPILVDFDLDLSDFSQLVADREIYQEIVSEAQ